MIDRRKQNETRPAADVVVSLWMCRLGTVVADERLLLSHVYLWRRGIRLSSPSPSSPSTKWSVDTGKQSFLISMIIMIMTNRSYDEFQPNALIGQPAMRKGYYST